jgi:hypothetical protein
MVPTDLKSFVVRVPGSFETRLHDVNARLEIVATVQISTSERIAAIHSIRHDLTAAIAEAIDAVVRERMHSIHPARFYMRFSVTDEEREAQSVEVELIRLITRRLSDDPFHARVLNVVLKIGETDLIRRFRELQEATAGFSVTVELAGVEPMEFQGDLRMIGVHPDGWHTFRALTSGIEQITAQIRDQLLGFLHTRRVEELRYRDEVERVALQANVSTVVARYAGEQFGLLVRVSNFRRALSAFEFQHDPPGVAELRTAEPFERRLVQSPDLDTRRGMLARVEQLMERRNDLVDVDELRAVEEEIEVLRHRLSLEPSGRVLVGYRPDGSVTGGRESSGEVSAFDIALSMNLEGPPDWSERIDHYLYGVDDGK